MVLRLAAKQRSHGEHVWFHCRVLNTVLVVDMPGNPRYELRTQRVRCHHVLHGVLVGKVGDWQHSAESHLVVAQNLSQQRCPHGSFVPILVLHRQQSSGSLDENLLPRDCAAVRSASLSLKPRSLH